MGTWGNGIFENDAACDWLSELLVSNDLSSIERAIEKVNSVGPEYLDADAGAEGLAAAYAIALLSGYAPTELSDLVSWVDSHPSKTSASLIAPAAAAVHCVLKPPSELANLWNDSDLNEDWLARTTELYNWLKSRAESAPR